MRVICKKTLKGDGSENEDIYGIKDDFFWIIDGATDLFGLDLFDGEDDVACYIRQLSTNIGRICEEKKDLKDILCESIRSTNNDLNLVVNSYESYKLPSFAILIAKLNEDTCDYYILGDCTLVVFGSEQLTKISDERLYIFSRNNREGIRRLKNEDRLNDISERSIFQETRKQMNQLNGYWIGSPDGSGIEYGLTGQKTY